MQGFDAVNWESNVDFDLKAITFSYHSQNGEEGFPGDLNVFAKYSLSTNGKALQIEYSATSTKKTPINLSNHMYFNLAGHETGKYSRAMIFQLIFCYFFFLLCEVRYLARSYWSIFLQIFTFNCPRADCERPSWNQETQHIL